MLLLACMWTWATSPLCGIILPVAIDDGDTFVESLSGTVLHESIMHPDSASHTFSLTCLLSETIQLFHLSLEAHTVSEFSQKGAFRGKGRNWKSFTISILDSNMKCSFAFTRDLTRVSSCQLDCGPDVIWHESEAHGPHALLGFLLWKSSKSSLMNFNMKQVADKDEASKLDNSELLRLISSAWLVDGCIRLKSIGRISSTRPQTHGWVH